MGSLPYRKWWVVLLYMMAAGVLSQAQPNLWKSADATILFSPQKLQWNLSNSKLQAEFGFDSTGSFSINKLTNKTSKLSWAKSNSSLSSEIDCRIDSISYQLKNKASAGLPAIFIYDRFSVSIEPNKSISLKLVFLTGQLELDLYYAIYPNTAVIERWAELINLSSATKQVSQFDSINLHLAIATKTFSVYSITGLSQHLPYDSHILHPSFIFQKNILDDRKQTNIEIYSGGRSSERNLVWFAVQPDGSNDGIFTGIEWSGETRFICQKSKTEVSISYGLTNYLHELNRGEHIVTPKSFFGIYSGAVDNASNITHQFCRNYLAPKPPADFPWVMYNTWFSYGIDQDETRMKLEIDNAAEMGLEGFYLDAGWYQLSPRPTETGNADFSPGVGIWKENRTKYPAGIRALSDYCHQKGLKFGIWVEPERVDARAVSLETDPLTETMLAKHDHESISGDGNKTMLLCLGNPEARDWLKRQLKYVIETYNIDWLKWDNNSWGICNRVDHGHQAGDGNYAQIQGLYEVLDYLRTTYPNLIIEDCASGGNRMDFGIMQRAHIFWVHDDSYTNYVCRYHHFGTAYAFPPEYLNSWVIQEGDFTRALGKNKTIPKPTLNYLFRSRMLGACGISLRTLDWSSELKQQVKLAIDEYKRYRKYLKGEFYHLTPQTVIYNQTWEPPKSWEAFQYKLNNESVVFYFRDDTNTTEYLVFPQGLDAKKNYEIYNIDSQKKIRYTGRTLIQKGLSLKLSYKFTSGIILVKRTS
jgi:alpha-galactosidase